MERRNLGRTGLKIAPISFGGITASRLSEEDLRPLVNRAIDEGVNYFDCAHSYSDTSRKLGRILPERRREVHIGLKVLDRGKDEAYERLLSSLEDLQMDSSDMMWLHAVDLEETLDEVLGDEGAVHALVRAREEGLTRFLGITGHRPDLLAQAVRRFPFDVVMTPVNYRYRFSFGAEGGLIPLCRRKGIGVVAIKPRAYQRLPDPATCYRYVLAQGVTTIIPHGSVDEFTSAMGLLKELDEMSREEEADLLRSSPELEGICRQCGYCLPCPESIDIPLVLRLGDMWHGPHRVGQRSPGYAVQDWARRRYGELLVKGDACTSCGICEDRCPFAVSVQENLKSCHSKLVEDGT